MDENKGVKQVFISSCFDNEKERLAFLPRLFEDGHPEEAITLCCVYIDRYAQKLFWSNENTSGKNFVDALVTFGALGDDAFLALVHPLQAIRRFKQMAKVWQEFADRLETVFPGPKYELHAQSDFLVKLAAHFSSQELNQIRGEIWRTTIAAIVYYWFRNPSVHELGAPENLSFSGSTYKGKPVQDLDFKKLHDATTKLLAELRRRSDDTGQFFGDDRSIGLPRGT